MLYVVYLAYEFAAGDATKDNFALIRVIFIKERF